MSVNAMQFEQAAGLMNGILSDATGAGGTQITNLGEYVTVGTTLLQMAKDPILRALNQMFQRTVIGVRPYDEILTGMEVNNESYGSIVRKLNWLDKKVDTDHAFPLDPVLTADPADIKDGVSVDMYVQNKDAVVQTNFYGANVFSDWRTIYDDQLRSAFTSPAGMAEFWAGSAMVMNNKLKQVRENQKRVALNNLIGGRIAQAAANQNTECVIDVLAAYKAATGNATITAANWQSAAEIKDFVPWLYGFLNTLLGYMRNRSMLYHTQLSLDNVAGRGIDQNKVLGLMRQTAPRDARVYLLSEVANQIDAQVMPSTYHNDLLRFTDYERIDFWQSITDPGSLTVTPTYLNASGGLETAEEAVEEEHVIGVIFDRDAAGISVFDEGTYSTPYNARGRYYNQWYHETVRFWNDFTENSVVLVMR